MSQVDPSATVGSLVTERPSRSKVLEQYGIDYCCGGHRTLSEASSAAGVELDTVLGELERQDASSPESEPDWASMGITELVDHIEETHHVFTKEAIQRLDGLFSKVLRAHGERHPELHELSGVYEELRADIGQHLMKEEQVLHPMCRELEGARETLSFHCGTLSNPIQVMGYEHDEAGELLGRMREMTGGYVTPDDACNTWRALYDGLAELEADLHLHIHKENNLLHPKVLARESELANAG